jgi:hypothetical protein
MDFGIAMFDALRRPPAPDGAPGEVPSWSDLKARLAAAQHVRRALLEAAQTVVQGDAAASFAAGAPRAIRLVNPIALAAGKPNPVKEDDGAGTCLAGTPRVTR